MEISEAIDNLRNVTLGISFGQAGGESRTYVKVPFDKGQDFANTIADSLVALGAITTECSSPAEAENDRFFFVKSKGGADKVKEKLIQNEVNFPGSGLSALKKTA